MSGYKIQGSPDFAELIDDYFDSNLWTKEAETFEADIDQRIYDHLQDPWQNGWDFDTEREYFGGRGASVLIQNSELAWKDVWDWILPQIEMIPDGALLNFEVFDTIRGDLMVGGPQILRRVITSEGIYEEVNETA